MLVVKPGVLFFSRGRGKGHAVPDHFIAEHLRQEYPSCEIIFVSYATGAITLRELGNIVIDLELPELNNYWLTMMYCGRLISRLNPTLVISHEEFAVPVACAVSGIHNVFLTDWYMDPASIQMRSLKSADHILYMDRPGTFAQPDYIKDRVQYCGQFVRPLRYGPADRRRARLELDIPPEAFVLLCIPGNCDDQVFPLWDTLLEAFTLLQQSAKLLIYVAGREYGLLSQRSTGRGNIRVISFDSVVERLMVAADVAVTKATRKTSLELESLGIPMVSILTGTNPIDDERVGQIPGVLTIHGNKLTASCLYQAIMCSSENQRAELIDSFHNHGFREVVRTLTAILTECARNPASRKV